MKHLLIIAALAFANINAIAQADSILHSHLPSMLSEWSEQPLPLDEWQQSGLSNIKLETELYVDRGGVCIKQKERTRGSEETLPFSLEAFKSKISGYGGTRGVLRVGNGLLVGFNDGRNGDLWWFSKTGDMGYSIAKLNVLQFTILENEVYVLLGQNANSIHGKGNIVHIIQRIDDKWIEGRTFKLDGYPYCHTIYDGRMYVVAGSKLVLFQKYADIYGRMDADDIISFPFDLTELNPSSMLFNNNSLYIAMRGGVLEVENIAPLLKHETRWSIPDDEREDHNDTHRNKPERWWAMRWWEPQ